jgi:tRNA-dihydrouridine synthase
MNFWKKMKKPHDAEALRGKPIMCLAPMADVTDAAFRFVISKCSKKVSKTDFEQGARKSVFDTFVTYTEFVSADGLVLAPEKGRKKLLKDLEFSKIERPVVAQIFGSKPENIEKAARLITELGFDGLDINMGCPDRSIEKQGAGAALMKNPQLAREIIKAAKRGVLRAPLRKSLQGEPLGIPVSVKTRLGYSKDELETWLPELLAENPAAIIIHARTRKEMSKVPARWERIKKAVEIRDSLNSKTLIIGNGDVKNLEDAKKKYAETGADGSMLGRAVFGNPWLFSAHYPDSKEIIKILLEHTKLFDKKFSGIKSFAIMKKHFKEYLKSPELRGLKFKLMRTETAEEAEKIIKDYLTCAAPGAGDIRAI